MTGVRHIHEMSCRKKVVERGCRRRVVGEEGYWRRVARKEGLPKKIGRWKEDSLQNQPWLRYHVKRNEFFAFYSLTK